MSEWHERIAGLQYTRYVEPFLGGAALFFSTKPAKALLADSNNRLIETYAAIRDDWALVLRHLRCHDKKHCREYYYHIRSAVFADPFERAAQFIYLNRTCWNGLYRVNRKGQFNVPIGTKCKRVIHDYDDFSLVSQALKNASLLCQDFESTIDDTKIGDLLFVDPPYTVKHNLNGFVKYNEQIFSWADQERLCASLLRAKERGVKVYAMNANHESITRLYQDHFNVTPLCRPSRIANDPRKRGRFEELLIQG